MIQGKAQLWDPKMVLHHFTHQLRELMRMGWLPLYSSYEGTNSLYFPDRSIPEIDKLRGHPYGYGKDGDADHSAFLKNATAAAGVRLSDTHMASRRAEEAGQAIS